MNPVERREAYDEGYMDGYEKAYFKKYKDSLAMELFFKDVVSKVLFLFGVAVGFALGKFVF